MVEHRVPHLTVCRGLPASGKSTFAKAWADQDPQWRVRINRDDLRAMAHQSKYVKQDEANPGTERVIVAMRDGAIGALLRKGVSVIVDDTNLPAKTVRELAELAEQYGATFELVPFEEPLETLLKRNRERNREIAEGRSGKEPVPDEVVEDYFKRFCDKAGRLRPVAPPEVVALEPYVLPAPSGPGGVWRPDVILVDIDGTVALMNGRGPYDETRVGEDLPNEAVIEAVAAFQHFGYNIVFMSGRSEACRAATEEWLHVHVEGYTGTPHVALYMRAEGDQRKDSVVKRELFDRHVRDQYRVRGVIDDRKQVVEMWRRLGLTVFQVAEGDF